MSNVLKNAADALSMCWAVGTNSGRIPAGHQCMVLIEPTSVCNLSCPLCPTGTGTLKRERKFIDLAVVDRIIEVTAPVAEGFVLNLFGEPTLHPQFADILEKTSHLPTWLSTHLIYKPEVAAELAKWPNLRIICSIDTLDAEEYPEYRKGGNYERLLENLAILAGGKCEVYPQFLIPESEKDEQPYREFARKYGIPEKNLHLKIKLENFRLDPTDKPVPGVCHWPYGNLYFNCDGYMLPCCNNVDESLHMAHIDEINSVEDLYAGPRGVAIRKQLARDKNHYVCCGRCEGRNFWKTDFQEYLRAASAVGKRILP